MLGSLCKYYARSAWYILLLTTPWLASTCKYCQRAFIFLPLSPFYFSLFTTPEGRDNLTELCDARKRGGKGMGVGGRVRGEERTLSRAYSDGEVGWKIKEEIVSTGGEGWREECHGLGSLKGLEVCREVVLLYITALLQRTAQGVAMLSGLSIRIESSDTWSHSQMCIYRSPLLASLHNSKCIALRMV